ncbi:hypothetical protein ES705_46464 [subsurface metagenome]
MEIENFCEIKAIDEARAKKIIKWYNKTDYEIAIIAGGGCSLDTLAKENESLLKG